MFEGRKYVQTGWGGKTIQFANLKKRAGVATTTYSKAMTNEEREEMARRITAALNLTRHLSVDEIERMESLQEVSAND